MTRHFRGCVYDIRVGLGAKRERVTVDGRVHDGRLIPAFADGRRHTVVVRLTDPVVRASAVRAASAARRVPDRAVRAETTGTAPSRATAVLAARPAATSRTRRS
jgi:hypothetical protein